MSRIKYVALVAAFVGVLGVPVVSAARAAADAVNVNCTFIDIITIESFSENPEDTNNCDLQINKQVSVNGGSFVDADTAATAANAVVGDTLTWRITVSNSSDDGFFPDGTVSVTDVIPAGISPTSVEASAGDYSDGVWSFDLNEDTLPATLTITSTATAAGVLTNTATLSGYLPTACEDEESDYVACENPAFIDANSDNNSNSAYVTVTAPSTPVVVTPTVTPAVPHTGFGVAHTNPASTLAIFSAASMILAAAALISRRVFQK